MCHDGLGFRQPKVKDVQDNRVASQLEADSTASYGFSAIIATSNLRGSRLAASGLRSRRPQLGWRRIQEKFQPAAVRRPPLAIPSAGTHQRSLALIDEPATRQAARIIKLRFLQLLS